MLGEIDNFTALSADQVDLVREHPEKAAEVCPDGDILCQTCETPLRVPGDAAAPTAFQGTGEIDFKKITGSLVRPGSGQVTKPSNS